MDLPPLEPLPSAAELIRNRILEGMILPGTPLPENELARQLQVSRGTVREAFRMLPNEHLRTYEVDKGMSVRSLAAADVRDIYRLRRMIELSAVDALAAGEATLDGPALGQTVDEGRRAAAEGDWAAVGTANLRFHAQLVATHGSPRMDEFFRRLMAEMRLGFLAVQDDEGFHGAYLRRNQQLRDLLAAGDWAGARAELAAYLDDAKRQVAEAVDRP